MKQSDMKRAPSLGGWFIAAAAGLVAAAVALVVGDFDYTSSGFIGLVVFLVVGLILGMYWGPQVAAAPKSTDMPQPIPAPAAEPVAAAPAMAAPAVAAPAKAAPAATSVSGPAAMFTSTPPAAPAKPAPTAKPKAAAKPAAKAKAAAKPAAAEAPKGPKVAKPAGPVRLTAPRKSKADDLKEIEGIGPALEKLCNSMGFYHFDQIASWSDADVALVDAEMTNFKGRIARDKWVAQAKIIVSEGLEAFRIRAKTNNY
jgi:predicted flap endonuclease-1-like 5' DNA nuclease